MTCAFAAGGLRSCCYYPLGSLTRRCCPLAPRLRPEDVSNSLFSSTLIRSELNIEEITEKGAEVFR